MSTPNPIGHANLAAASKNSEKLTKDKDENDNQTIEPKNTKSVVYQLINQWNAETIKRYKELQQKKQSLSDTKNDAKKEMHVIEVDEQGELPEELKESLKPFPELLKFISENEKAKDPKNALLKNFGLGILERALFRSIEKQDVEFVEQLILLGVDVDCVAREPLSAREKFRNMISPLYYCLTPRYLSYNFGDSSDLGFFNDLKWTCVEATKRSQMIEALIMAGARIDSADTGYYNDPFLHRLCICAIKFPEMLRVLLNILSLAKDLNLNLNVESPNLNYRKMTPLIFLIHKILSWQMLKPENEIIPYQENYRIIVKALIASGRQDYNLSLRNPDDHSLFDAIIYYVFNVEYPPHAMSDALLEIFAAIFQDMALQALNHVLTNVNPNVLCNPEKELLDFAVLQFAKNTSYYRYYSPTAMREIEGKVLIRDRISIAVYDKIVLPAIKMIKEQYSIGYSLSEIQTYFSSVQLKTVEKNFKIDPLWHIVLEYCFPGSLFYVFAADKLRQHYPLEHVYFPINIEKLYRYFNSFQIVSLPYKLLTDEVIEKNPAFSLSPSVVERDIASTDLEQDRPNLLTLDDAPQLPRQTVSPYSPPLVTKASSPKTAANIPPMISDVKTQKEQHLRQNALPTKKSYIVSCNKSERFEISGTVITVQPSLIAGSSVLQFFKSESDTSELIPNTALYLDGDKYPRNEFRLRLKLRKEAIKGLSLEQFVKPFLLSYNAKAVQEGRRVDAAAPNSNDVVVRDKKPRRGCVIQ